MFYQFIQCPDCLIEFDNCASLFQHLRQPHIDDNRRYSHLNGELHESDNSAPSPAVRSKADCTICNVSIGSSHHSRRRHYDAWHADGRVDCPHCVTSVYFRDEWQLAVHLANHHQIHVKQPCDKCDHAHSYYRQFSDGRYYAYHYNCSKV